MNNHAFRSINDIFHEHQMMVLKWFLFSMSALLLPFDINHFIQGRYLLGGALAGTVIIFLANAVSIHLRGTPAMPYVIVFLPIAGTLWVAITVQGAGGVLWTYPSILLAHYTLPRFVGNAIAIFLAVMVTLLAYQHISLAIALRVGATLGVTIVFANIFMSMIARLNARMSDLATVDSLTGAYNRRHLELSISRPVELKKRYGTPMSMLIIDVDHFKQINDRFGHAAGDTVLKDIASRLRTSLRTIDLLFRVGGEEFLALLPESDLSAAKVVAEKLRLAIAAQPFDGLQVTVSIGAGELEAGEEGQDLIKRCDDALYQAKSLGRNQVYTSAGNQPE